jgi:hypothetical protein
MGTHSMTSCMADSSVARSILKTLAACLTFSILGCATPNFMSPDSWTVNRGNDLLMEGKALADKQDWAAADKTLTAAIAKFNEQTRYNADDQISEGYAALARAQASTAQCDAAGYSLRSAVNLRLLSPGAYGDAEMRTRIASDYIDAVPHCLLSDGSTLSANAEKFMRSKLPQLGATLADIDRRRAEAKVEDARRRDEEHERLQAVLGATQAVAGQVAAQREARAAAERTANQAAERERQRQAMATLAKPAPAAAPVPNYAPKAQPDTGRNTASQMHSGNARDMSAGTHAGTSGRSSPGTGAGTPGASSPPAGTARFQSQDASTCVEIVPKGFKCNGPHDRFLVNICRTKIYVEWRLGNDAWAGQHLAPAQCHPVSYYKDDRAVQHRACSWDAKASYGPSTNPCHY